MDYFKDLAELLKIEKLEDQAQYKKLTESASIGERRANGLTWYPVAIRGQELGRGDYLTVEFERTTHQDLPHQFRFGIPAVLFSNHDPKVDKIEGVVTHQGGNRLKLNLRTDELPDWSRDGKLGLEVLFDNTSYEEMFSALKKAENTENKDVIKGLKPATFNQSETYRAEQKLNGSQNQAVSKILNANELAIVHGPPGTGKTTTLVAAITKLAREKSEKILVVAPSNAAVDLLSEKLYEAGLNVMRVGNPVRVSEGLSALTMDGKMKEHPAYKDIKKLKIQANEYKNMAHKYKRNFGKAERDQRKALFDEAHKIMKEVEKTEQYILDDLASITQVVTATLVGSNHYSVEKFEYDTVVIDEAGQALETACWIPILKGKKVVLAGDHCQLPPTIKSPEAARKGLEKTLLEKLVEKHPEAVVLLDTQYRMNEQIMAHSSKTFYKNQLKAHSSVASHRILSDILPVQFIDTAGCGFNEKLEGTSSTNPEEAAFLVKRVESLIDNWPETDIPSIAIISPYKQQIQVLSEYVMDSAILKPFLKYISVNTIDSFQGQERDAVFISMTRSNLDGEIGFVADIRRMNVAMTRARKLLVIVGDSATIGNFPYYSDFITYAESIGAYKSAWELMY
jgi:ATP-dependent RNA/DNA helicase IGHMBP2